MPPKPTSKAVPEEGEVDCGQDHEEGDEESVVVVADAGGEPRAVMVKAIAACLAQFTMLSAIRNHYLKHTFNMQKVN